ncbi:TPA: hypothetical protein ACKRIH_003232 [Proteus mirabilis]
MSKIVISVLVIAVLNLLSINTVSAQNYPCSGKKGGVSYLTVRMVNLFVMMEAQANQNEFVLMKVIQRKNRTLPI